MTATQAFGYGIGLALTVGLTLATINGLTARFDQSNRTMEQIIRGRIGGA